MGRLTVNKRTADMNMVELAHNCCYARDRRAMYRDYDGDYDARELTRLMFKVYTEINLPLSDEEFDWHMSEALGEPMDTKIGMLALFYRNLWAMAELHDRLKHYEDLEEAGRLVVLPCKVGDTVYMVDGDEEQDWIDEYEIKYFYVSSRGVNRIYGECGTLTKNFIPKNFGKTVFLTLEEAEAALKGGVVDEDRT